MRKLIFKIIIYWFYWLVLFSFFRLVFIIYYISIIQENNCSLIDLFSIFYFAFKLDLSTIGYFFVFPLLISYVWIFFQSSILNKISNIYNFFLIIFYSIISFGEIGIYNEWRTKLNYKALLYLKQPQEIFNSISTFVFIFLFIGVIILIILWIRIYFKKVQLFNFNFYSQIYKKIIFIIISPIIVFYFIRGGFKEIPISQSQSWFSNKIILNDISVNPGWNLINNIIDAQSFIKNNPFVFYDDIFAEQSIKEIHKIEKDTTTNILTTQRPNIVFIILESWTADVVGALGNDSDITPNFNGLAKEGILFSEFYSNGNRSQQGLASIFSGFPALPITTITDHPAKYSKLPSIIKILNKEGYNSSFYFGGQLIYGNIKSYIIFNEFKKIIEEADIESNYPRGKLGVHDEYLFLKNIKDLKAEQEPFVSAIFTLSSHSPYDQPIKNKITREIKEKEFVNSVWYSDYSLGKYFDMARQQNWYKNTLFVIVADHSHVSHKQHYIQTFEYHKIPLLLYGEVLKQEFKGTINNKIATHIDIASTLLKQLDMKDENFKWSKNLFNPYSNQFAFFEMNEGLGWKTKEGYFIYNNFNDVYLDKKIIGLKEDSIVKQGKSYLQVLYKDFLSY